MRAIIVVIALALTIAAGGSANELPRFEDFRVKHIHRGKAARLRLTTHRQRRYRTMIRDGVQQGVNFGGSYGVVKWGCGTGCVMFAVADVVSGRVYDPPMNLVAFHYGGDHRRYDDFLTFRRDSRLLVVEGCPDDHKCGRHYYEFVRGRYKLLAYDPDSPTEP